MSEPADTGDKIAVDKLPLRHRQRRAEITLLATLNDDPEWWTEQLEAIKDGKSLEELATELSVKFGVFRNWILGDTKREKQYIEAYAERKRRMNEKIEEKLYKTALNPTGWPKHSDALRAAEILRNGPVLQQGGGSSTPSINIVFVAAQDGKPAQATVEQGVTIDHIP